MGYLQSFFEFSSDLISQNGQWSTDCLGMFDYLLGSGLEGLIFVDITS